MGLKITDLDAVHPQTKLPFKNINEMNSSNNSYPLCMVIRKESKEMIKENFKCILDFYASSSIGDNDAVQNPFMDLGYLPFDLCIPADMKAH